MDAIADVLIEYGTEAVLTYKRISGLKAENELPEAFIESYIAPRLYDRLGRSARIQWPYKMIAGAVGIPFTAMLETEIGGWKTDLAVFDGERPVAVVEVKIFDEGCSVSKIQHDLRKARHLLSPHVASYAAVVICEAGTALLEARIDALNAGTGALFRVGPIQHAVGWRWCFGAAKAL